MTTATQTDWLDGPKLVDWLTDRGILTNASVQLGRADESLVRRWADGGAAGVYVADRVLCRLGVCLGEIPVEFYRHAPDRSYRSRLSEEVRQRITELAGQGHDFAAISRTLGVDPKTAAKYAKAAA